MPISQLIVNLVFNTGYHTYFSTVFIWWGLLKLHFAVQPIKLCIFGNNRTKTVEACNWIRPSWLTHTTKSLLYGANCILCHLQDMCLDHIWIMHALDWLARAAPAVGNAVCRQHESVPKYKGQVQSCFFRCSSYSSANVSWYCSGFLSFRCSSYSYLKKIMSWTTKDIFTIFASS